MYVPSTTANPPVPPHICPGRKVVCPDCGQEFHMWPQPTWGPMWVISSGATGGTYTTSANTGSITY